MKIDIKEINKISLKKNELLIIHTTAKVLQKTRDALKNGFEKIKSENWENRILIMSGDVKLTKITKEK